MMATIGVVIVNFNAGEHLARCLASLAHGLGAHDWHAVVVDNASADGSEGAALAAGERVALVRAGTNLGFATAVNQGARAVAGDALLLLNPDCRLEPGCVEPLLADLAEHPECAVVAPNVVNEDGSPQGNARGDPTLLTGLFGRSSALRRAFPGASLSRSNVILPAALAGDRPSIAVDWVAGSCLLTRREAFDAVGGLDGAFFLYWEDADYCRRLRAAGWTTRFRADARVTHVGGRSTHWAATRALYEFHRSAYRYYARHCAPSPWDPRRLVARGLLAARWLALRAVLGK
jgi:hypothetical protein